MSTVSSLNSVYNNLMDTVSSPPPAQQAEQRQLNLGVIQAVKTLNKSEYFGENNELTFQLDRGTGRPVIKILSKQTKEVISQIPPEYVLEIAQSLGQEKS